MKKIFYFLTILAFGFTQAQPQKVNYQAVALTAGGQTVKNQAIKLRLSILDSSATGTVLYSETHQPTTDGAGQFSVFLGGGTATLGTFSNIAWSNGKDKFLKAEADVTGGTNYVLMGTSQIVSVPYALYSASSGSSIPGPPGPRGPVGAGCLSHFIGELFGGGVIFHLWKDSLDIEHGLIVDLIDLSNNQVWSNVTTSIGQNAESSWNGLNNSVAIVSQLGHSNSAALLCLNSNNGGQNDWYLPSIDELNLLWQNRFDVNKSLSSILGANILPTTVSYWSSTENGTEAWLFGYNNGSNGPNNNFFNYKTSMYWVRAIRSF